MKKNKTIILGLDGATFTLLRPMMERGYLPNLKYVADNGVSGELESVFPYSTGPSWASFATGKFPGKHGCFDFVLPLGRENQLVPITANNIRSETFYEILYKNKLDVTLINLPVSFPPRISQTLITSLLTRSKNCVFPEKLKEAIPSLKNYQIRVPGGIFKKDISKTLLQIREIEKRRFLVSQDLYKRPWDVFFLLFSGSDWVQHLCFTELIANLNQDTITPAEELFKDLDNYIGWFVRNLPPRSNLFIISDHGFNSYRGTFSMNKWLRLNGYLELGNQMTTDISELKRDGKSKIIKHQMLLKSKSALYRHSPTLFNLGKQIFKLVKKMSPESIYSGDYLGINSSKTLAFCPTSTSLGIYINDSRRFKNGIVKGHNEYEELRDRLISELGNIREPVKGDKVFKAIYKKEQIYKGKMSFLAPDVLFEPGNLWTDAKYENEDLFNLRTHNNHSRNGVFIAFGPDIKQGERITPLSIVDLAPTILHMMNCPIPKEVDGKIIWDTYKEGSQFLSRKPIFKATESFNTHENKNLDDSEAVKSRLKGLGYL